MKGSLRVASVARQAGHLSLSWLNSRAARWREREKERVITQKSGEQGQPLLFSLFRVFVSVSKAIRLRLVWVVSSMPVLKALEIDC